MEIAYWGLVIGATAFMLSAAAIITAAIAKNAGAQESKVQSIAQAGAGCILISFASFAVAIFHFERSPDETCRQSPECWARQAEGAALVACQRQIERSARYQYEWTSWLSAFSTHRWADQSQGLVTVAGDQIKMQNGFGAWQQMFYACTIDPATDTLLHYEVMPRNS